MNTEDVLATLESDFRDIVRKILTEAEKSGHRVLLTSGRRTMAEQARLYAKGRTEAGKIVTNALPGSSAHNFGLAVDFCPFKPDGKTLDWNDDSTVWEVVGVIAEHNSMMWGGRFHSFVDKPHIEHPRWKLVQAEWKAGKLEVK